MKGAFWWAVLIGLMLLGIVLRRGALAVFVLVLALATVASELWARCCLSNVTYRRHLGSRRLSYGEETTLVLEFVNAKPLPLAWLLVRDRFPAKVRMLTCEPGSPPSRRRGWLSNFLSLRWYERVARTYWIRGEHRGHFRFGPARVSSGDVFGFRRRSRVDSRVDTLIVYPKVVPVQALGLPAGRPMGDWFARRRVMEDPLRFAAVREYAPGDNPRYIHWKASARRGSLQVKAFDPSDTLLLTIAVDVQTSRAAFGYIPEYLEYAISAAASLAIHALNQRHMVGICANTLGREGKPWAYLRPSRHPQHAPRLLAALAALPPLRRLPLEEMLHGRMSHLPFGGTVVAITAVPGEPLYQELVLLERAGHPTLLLTVGDTIPQVPEPLRSHHLGGRDAWHRLEALALA